MILLVRELLASELELISDNSDLGTYSFEEKLEQFYTDLQTC